MTEGSEGRFVVRLSCGHEALEVVPAPGAATPVGASFSCRECGWDRTIVESFRVDP